MLEYQSRLRLHAPNVRRVKLHEEKKKRQHFVWRKYLRKWASNGRIFCLMGERVFETGLMSIAQEKYFYELKELSEQEISLLKAVIECDSRPMIRRLNHNWIELFDNVFRLKRQLGVEGIASLEIDKMLDTLICNLEEDFHCSIESEGDEFLELLYNRDLSFYDDDERLMSFLFFICQQYFRTQNVRHNVTSLISESNSFKDVNIDAMWSVLRHVCATSFGCSLYQERDRFRLIMVENNSGLPFITGDQPVINTHAVGLRLEEEPEEVELYYPITPSIALLLTGRGEYHAKKYVPANETDVWKYNKYIFDQSGKQVYSSSRDALERMRVE